MENRSPKFKYILCPGSGVHSSYSEIQSKIYQCWTEVWTQAFTDLGCEKPLVSDSFTRQSYIGGLFADDSCMALCFFREADASRPEFSKDSYFANWSADDIKKLTSRGPKIIVCSNFTIHPKARGTKLGISAKDLLTGISIETFLNSQADGMTGALRVDRRVNDACLRWGGYLISSNVPSGHGDSVDLMGFFKDHIAQQPRPELKSLAEQIWLSSEILPSDSYFTKDKFSKQNWLKVA